MLYGSQKEYYENESMFKENLNITKGANMSFQYKDLSDKRCSHPGCNKRLKKKIVVSNPQADRCFFHYNLDKRLKTLHKAPNNHCSITADQAITTKPA